ncbi:MAG TPA: hypothetical protein VGZ29_00980 [Terriglobia bacterium]|nr:hypothetical protein [Terriglobia bacterium]
MTINDIADKPPGTGANPATGEAPAPSSPRRGGGDIGSHAAGAQGDPLRVPGRHRVTAAAIAANRANARKSTGPRTAAGKQQVSRNRTRLQQSAARLQGLTEARLLGQQPGAAEDLYRELTRPYEPVPAMLAMHFHDLARLRLELEAWERIRDSQLEERWRQGGIERRRRCHDLLVDLPGTAEEIFDQGVNRFPDSPAKARKQVECYNLLKDHIEGGDYDIAHLLRTLYGKDLKANTDRGETIVMRCERLMKPETGPPLTEPLIQELIRLLNDEEEAAVALFSLYVDKTAMPESECRSRLGTTREDRSMSLQGERLRSAIDRKHWVINSLLQTLRLTGTRENTGRKRPRRQKSRPLPPKNLHVSKPTSASKSTKR